MGILSDGHTATILAKETPDDTTIYRVICAQCSDYAEFYIRCEVIADSYPYEVVEHKPKKMSVLDKIATALNYHR